MIRKKGCILFPPIKIRNYIFLFFYIFYWKKEATTSLASNIFSLKPYKVVYLTLIDDHYEFMYVVDERSTLCVKKDVTFLFDIQAE